MTDAAAANAPPLIAIVGPTAVGKTATAISLCQQFDGEIVSADSRQIYRHMDIGTAKPSAAEQAAAVHHLIDIVEPEQTVTLAEFQSLAYRAINNILAHHRLPFLVGGTGQWVRAVVEGWGVPRVPPDLELRARLQAEAEQMGAQHLHDRLAAVDVDAAAKIDPRNVRRVIRALEVFLKTGEPITALQKAQPPPYNILMIGLTMPRDVLYARIDERIDRMVAQGLEEEVEHLMERGCGLDLPAMSGLGYRQIGQYLQGDISREEAIQLTKKETRRFVRQQYNWFREDDAAIHWYDMTESPMLSIARAVEAHLADGALR
jgi:tRNA dimethylallyltransferase